MDRHILLTISDDPSALQGIRFTADFFANTQTFHVTLLYVAPNPKAGLTEKEIMQDYGNLKLREEQTKNTAEIALSRAEELLMNKHFPRENIHKKIAFKQLGTAHDIIQEGISGMYDAIALGRRGLSRLEELIEDSISKKIFTTPMEIPLWICRNQQAVTPPHILLCSDGSKASLRCADHVGFMLKDEPRHTITILHVDTGATPVSQKESVTGSTGMLLNNGVAPERIASLVVKGRNAHEAILKTAQEGKFGVIAMGRTGRGETHSRHLLGSVSMQILTHLDFATMWISH